MPSDERRVDTDNNFEDRACGLTRRQKEIITMLEDGREFTTDTIAEAIGLKGPRTRQILKELVELGMIVSLGTTKGRRYRRKCSSLTVFGQ